MLKRDIGIVVILRKQKQCFVFRYKVNVSAARLRSWVRILCAKHLKFAPDKTATPTRVWWYMDALIPLDLYVVIGTIGV